MSVDIALPIAPEVSPFLYVLEFKKRIEEVEARVSKIDGLDVNKVRLFIEIAEAIGFWRCSQCKMNSNNVCTGWRLSQELANRIAGLAGQDSVVQQDGVYRVSVSKVPFVGVYCTIHIPKA